MSYSTYLCLTMATLLLTPAGDAEDSAGGDPALADVLEAVLERIRTLIDRLRREPLSPCVVAQFERELQEAVRELARVVTEWTYNHLEPAAPQTLPTQVRFEGSPYRRLSQKTPQQASTL